MASTDVFRRKGVAETRVEDLLEAAGIARRTFYKYFSDKHDVLATLYEHVVDELFKVVSNAGAAGGDPLAGLHAGLDAYLEYHTTNREIVRIVMEEAVRSSSPLAPIRKRFRERLLPPLGRMLSTAAGRDLDELVVVALISALEGLSLELLGSTPRPGDVERVRATVLGLVEAVVRSPDALPQA